MYLLDLLDLLLVTSFVHHDNRFRSGLEHDFLVNDRFNPVLCLGILHVTVNIHHLVSDHDILVHLDFLEGNEWLLQLDHLPVEDVMSDDHHWGPVLCVVQVADELSLQLLLVPALQVALHLDHEGLLWARGRRALHMYLHVSERWSGERCFNEYFSSNQSSSQENLKMPPTNRT